MFIFDIETLGKDSSSVILSMACIHFDPKDRPSYSDLVQSAFFVKLDVEDQIKRLKRTTMKSTMIWWSKQCENARNKSFRPSTIDVAAEDSIEQLREYSKKFEDPKKTLVWARGNLDQLVLDSLEEQLEVPEVFHFSKWRDVRTALDFISSDTSGYPKVNYEGFNINMVTKHDPVHDCAFDAMMLMYSSEDQT